MFLLQIRNPGLLTYFVVYWTGSNFRALYAVCYLQRNSHYSVVLAVLLFFYYLFFLHAFFFWDDGHIIVFGKLYCCFYNAVAWKISVRVMLRKSIFIACSFVSKLNRWHAVYTLLFCAKCELRCWDYTVWTKGFSFQIRCLISKVKLRGFRVEFPRIIIIIQVTQVQRKNVLTTHSSTDWFYSVFIVLILSFFSWVIVSVLDLIIQFTVHTMYMNVMFFTFFFFSCWPICWNCW